jgi:MoaA/NifB/PqqE/SkfB family radical SAM enzyme
MACNISCVMCPWKRERSLAGEGLMSDDVWAAVSPYLPAFEYVDLSGGGEPLLNPALPARLAEAGRAGCKAGFLTNATLLDFESASRILDAEPHWIGVSLDGASAETYETVRRGAEFDRVVENVSRLAGMRRGTGPDILVQAVIMPANVHELPDIVRLAADMGASVVVLKNCDVVRSESAQERAMYEGGGAGAGRGLKKSLRAAAKAARRAGIELRTYSARPDEQPVCEQDPRRSLFVACDGRVSPCIGLAYGGEGRFFGEKTVYPEVVYGRLPQDDLMEAWRGRRAARYRDVFERRVRAYDRGLSRIEGDMDPIKFRRLLDDAARSMPPAPEGCARCHYLYGV